jgi:MoxR-like ATPase
MGVPAREEEVEILTRHDDGFNPRDLRAAGLGVVAGQDELTAGREAVLDVDVSADMLGYVVDVCRATRTAPAVQLGASPRAATALLATSKAWAWLSGRDFVTPDDVKALSRPTLRHRLMIRPEAELDGMTADGVLDTVLASVPVPK